MPGSSRSRALTAAALVAAIVAGVGVAIVNASPSSTPTLPRVSPDALVASVLRAAESRTPVSGVVSTHLDLGFPQLPASVAGGQAAGLTDMLSDQTLKVWRSPDGLRVAQILPFAERVLVANGSDAWLWDSQTGTALHYGIPAAQRKALASGRPPDPVRLAAKLVRAVRPYAKVSVGTPVRVAGRDAYTLELTPVSSSTLVGRIEVAVDASTRAPLRVEVFPKGSGRAAIEAGFTRVSFARIDPQMFSFSPPPGASVKQAAGPPGGKGLVSGSSAPAAPSFPDVRVSGKGFGVIVAVRASFLPKTIAPLLPYSGPLGSAQLVHRGRHVWFVAGLVTPRALHAAAQKLP